MIIRIINIRFLFLSLSSSSSCSFSSSIFSDAGSNALPKLQNATERLNKALFTSSIFTYSFEIPFHLIHPTGLFPGLPYLAFNESVNPDEFCLQVSYLNLDTFQSCSSHNGLTGLLGGHVTFLQLEATTADNPILLKEEDPMHLLDAVIADGHSPDTVMINFLAHINFLLF